MSIAIYLSPKSAGKSTTIYIQVNQHNPKGWIEKPTGNVIKLHKPLGGEVEDATNKAHN